MNVQLENEQITKLLNDWYQSMLKQQLVKAKQLKEYIDNEINNVKFQTRKTMGMRKRIC
ncbi:response regulator aspartate phosphatase [Bacillus thuringiensis]|uniref:response regulator aspartate phosphatase n=1 Tax=Bacillus thuringiensis TaxID=1428 RepID=UPI00030C5E70